MLHPIVVLGEISIIMEVPFFLIFDCYTEVLNSTFKGLNTLCLLSKCWCKLLGLEASFEKISEECKLLGLEASFEKISEETTQSRSCSHVREAQHCRILCFGLCLVFSVSYSGCFTCRWCSLRIFPLERPLNPLSMIDYFHMIKRWNILHWLVLKI